MHHATPLALLSLAIAHAAVAQDRVGWTWLATVDEPVIDPSKGITTQTVTLTGLMEADAPVVFLSAVIFDTLGAQNAELGHITGWQVLNSLDELTGDLTTTDGVSLYGTNAGQLCLWGPCYTDNPIDVLEFTWELNDGVDLDAPVEVVYATSTEGAWVKAGSDHDDAEVYQADIVNEAVFAWTIVPAPSTAALAAIALPIIARRRRRSPT